METRARGPGRREVLRQLREQDTGFTLIELLVVVIIIGILAAIAIPIFLSQRQKSYDAAAKSDVRQVAMLEETYLTDNLSYGSFVQIDPSASTLRATRGVTLTIVHFTGAQSYCLSAKHADSPTTWYYDSVGGGLQPSGATGCPVTTSGAGGGTVTG